MAAKTRKSTSSFWTFADSFEGDKVVWIIVLMLLLISIVCMFSSSSRLLTGDQTKVDLLREQFITVGGGLLVILLCYVIKDMRIFRMFSKLGFGVSFLLLAVLDSHADLGFVKAINLNGAYRILSLGGIQIHVFEVVKVAMVMYLAWALDAYKQHELRIDVPAKWQRWIYIYGPFLITMAMVIPGSNSSALFIGGIMFIVILLGGSDIRDLLPLFLGGVLLIAVCFGLYKVSNGKVMGRIGTGISRIFDDTDWEKQFLESPRGSKDYQEALDQMRQPVSAKIAIKEGGLLGKGPGQSTQRYVVPDISEDFMYSFIVEEYGILGGIVVIILYVSLLARGSLIVRNCGKDLFAKLAVAGLCILITGQAFLHMFVNADIGPMTGQTLPLISHGMSAFLCFSLAFGIILSFSRIASRRIDKETREAAPLMEMHETPERDNVQSGLDDLDAFESGEMEDIQDGYGI